MNYSVRKLNELIGALKESNVLFSVEDNLVSFDTSDANIEVTVYYTHYEVELFDGEREGSDIFRKASTLVRELVR